MCNKIFQFGFVFYYFYSKKSKMAIYEVTATVPLELNEKWLKYMKKHMKDLIETNCFESAKMKKIRTESDLVFSYVISYHYLTEDKFEFYQSKYQKQLQHDHKQHFPVFL